MANQAFEMLEAVERYEERSIIREFRRGVLMKYCDRDDKGNLVLKANAEMPSGLEKAILIGIITS